MNVDQFFAHVERFSQSEQFSDEELALNFKLGLIGEAGEIVDLIKKSMFHSQKVHRVEYVSELGDWIWYAIANLLIEIKKCESDEHLEDLTNQVKAAMKPNSSTIHGRTGTAMRVASRSVEYTCHGDYSALPMAVEEWAKLCHVLNVTPQEVMEFNVIKLEQRHKGQRFNAQTALASKAVKTCHHCENWATEPNASGDELCNVYQRQEVAAFWEERSTPVSTAAECPGFNAK